MGSSDKHRRAHECFNKRDWKGMREICSPQLQYTDHPRSLTMKSYEEFEGWLKEWTTGMSDAKPDEPEYLEAGDRSVALFKARGTNDGQLGPANATGKRIDVPFCEVLHWNADGKMARGEIYYDAMTMFVQLGVMEPPPQS